MTTGVEDKKATLNRVPSRTQPVKKDAPEYAEVVMGGDDTPVKEVPTKFEPRKREPEDFPPEGEKWEATQKRKKREEAEALTVEARMTETEQLGLDAGRCAEKVKTLRRDIQRLERNLVTTRQRLVDAEALLTYRLNELRDVGL